MPTDAPRRVVVMGVSGCGKSTVGRSLAAELGADFIEGDELHPPENVERMRQGIPLTDADRQGWLQTIGARLGDAAAQRRGLVVSCSALKRSYRDLLRAADPSLRFVYLRGSPELLERRMNERSGHYMPPSLLRSQLETLEPPGADEGAVSIDIDVEPQAIVAAARRALEC